MRVGNVSLRVFFLGAWSMCCPDENHSCSWREKSAVCWYCAVSPNETCLYRLSVNILYLNEDICEAMVLLDCTGMRP